MHLETQICVEFLTTVVVSPRRQNNKFVKKTKGNIGAAHSNVRGGQYTSLLTLFLINYEFQFDIFVKKVSLLSRDFFKLTPKYEIYYPVNLKNLGKK